MPALSRGAYRVQARHHGEAWQTIARETSRDVAIARGKSVAARMVFRGVIGRYCPVWFKVRVVLGGVAVWLSDETEATA